ncbi:glycosyltransferase [Actinocrinis sp.]|uniref:glycosyltransferase n=1 Tax=Actinocrinis sp. TaxID=1920516 RepID=UPI002D63DEA4|nr:glycosyltransferase [Actinocrinis sp.]HZP49627.1 glycosyltransferase [Actinocrinis sp.]
MVNYGFLSTYPPTQCGLATFCAALLRHLSNPMAGSRCGVVQVVDGAYQTVRQEPAAATITVRPLSASRTAEVLNRYDVLILQHEYGIYSGLDGADVLDVLDRVQIPVITVLHTVLACPTPHQRLVLQRVIDASDAVVVLSQTAAAVLEAGYLIGEGRLSVIPHGAPPLPKRRPRSTGRDHRPTILTWGLIGPGKGIEWAIAALSHLRDLQPAARYLVAGQTHPKVLAVQGEAYRDSLRRQARAAGVLDLVEFDPTYREVGSLMNMVRQADVVLLPYESKDQVTSGVLIEAVAAQRPVVATEFPHARELLAGEAGLVVPHRDPRAMAHAIRRVLTEPGLAEAMTARCATLAPALTWSAVANSYRALAKTLLAATPAVVAS